MTKHPAVKPAWCPQYLCKHSLCQGLTNLQLQTTDLLLISHNLTRRTGLDFKSVSFILGLDNVKQTIQELLPLRAQLNS